MDFWAVFRQSIKALMANKLRSVFSILGIVIGVMAVVIIVSMGEGLKALVTNEVEAFGPNILDIAIKIPGTSQMGTVGSMAKGIKVTTLRLSDTDDLADKQRFPYIEAVSGQAFGQEWATYEDKEKKVLIYGCHAAFPRIFKVLGVESGRFFTDDEDLSLSEVVVLGNGLAEDLFGDEDAINKKIKLKGQNFKVVGVLEPYSGISSGIGGVDMNDFAYLPIRTAFKKVLGIDYMSEVMLSISDTSYMTRAIREVSDLLRRNHHITDPDKDDFQITTMEQVLDTINDVTVVLNALLGFLAAISLLVGGVGIMNIMLVAVNERTREIGLRKALGATRSDILRQFLIESLVITGLGGTIGVVLGLGCSILSSVVIRFAVLADWPVTISWLAIFVSFVISVLIGLIFGVYPARKAANLDPIKAIRNE